MDSRGVAVPVLVGWTLFLWLSRVRNVLADDDLSRGGEAVRIGAAVVFLALGVVGFFAWRSRATRPARARLALWGLCGWTIGFWTVRGTGIILDDHPAGFTIVHTILMVLSIVLAVWAWPRRGRTPASMEPLT